MKLELKNIDTGSIGLSHNNIDLLFNQLLFDSSIKEDIFNISQNTDIVFWSPSNIDENLINKKRALQLEKEFTQDLITYLCEDDFEYGYENRADFLVKSQMEVNMLATKEWLNKIYVNNFNKPEVLISILRLVARIQSDCIFPEGKMMAIAALSHKDPIVQECGIRAFESWGTLDSLNILQNVKVSSDWLQEYLDKVIEDIKSEYAIFS